MYGHKYTDEEREFFLEFIPGHTYKEIQAAFSENFEWEITVSQIKGYMANHRINNGLTGRFSKGHVPPNKGKKGVCATGCEKSWFKAGDTPANHKPVGSERVSKDGYIEVKVKEPRTWAHKHRVVWEQYNGPVPKGKIITLLDGNPLNCDISNLRMIDRATHAVLNHTGLCYSSAEFKDTAIGIADLKRGISKARKRG